MHEHRQHQTGHIDYRTPEGDSNESSHHHNNADDHSGHRQKNDHTAHHRMMIEDFRRRFFVCLILTVPVLLFSPMIQHFLGFQTDFPGKMNIMFALASVVYFYGGRPFLVGLFDEWKKRAPGMMTLIAMAITVAYVYSTLVLFGLQGDMLFWELVTLIDIMLLGHWIEMKSVLSASSALEKLVQLLPDTAHKLEKGIFYDVKISSLSVGDIVLVKPGEKVPVDGIIVNGKSFLDESVLTGEAVPTERKEGNKVIAGSVNGDGALEVKVSSIGENSYLAKVVNLVREAQQTKSKTQRLADRAAFGLTIIALTAGIATFLAWLIAGESTAFAVTRAATVMVIACPHALGLAIPLVVAVSTSLSAKNGLLVRNRTAFEEAGKITAVIFDKTGTLTEGKFGVSDIKVIATSTDKEMLIRLAAAVEQNSEHPLAAGILAKAKEMELSPPQISEFRAYKGKGISAVVEGKKVDVVSPGYLEEKGIQFERESIKEAATTVYVLVNSELIGSITLSDRIRKESHTAVKLLKEMGIRCWMLTGDNRDTAALVSAALELDGYWAEVLPDEKLEKIKELQRSGDFVAMTGDGVNDAPALAQADVGIAVGSGTDVAAETADIILVDSNPADVVTLIRFGRATHAKMIQNLVWATAYNFFTLPLAAGVFLNRGIVISPAVGAVFMSLSTIVVAVNARLLRVEKKIEPYDSRLISSKTVVSGN